MRVLKNKNGMALITVMIIFLVLTALVGSLVILANGNLRQSMRTKENTTAYYTAEAGLTKAVTDFKEYVVGLSETSPALSTQAFMSAIDSYITNNASQELVLSENQGIIPIADITMEYSGMNADGYSIYTIRSAGNYGHYARTLSTYFAFKYVLGMGGNGFMIDKALMTKGSIQLTGSSQIIGAPISTYSTSAGAINLAWSTRVPAIELDPSLFDSNGNLINSNIFTTTSNINNIITEGGLNAVDPLDEVYEFPQITIPTYPNKTTLARLPLFSSAGRALVRSDGSILKNFWDSNEVVYNIPSTSTWYYVPEINISAGSNFTINVGDTDIHFVVDRLQLNNHFRVTGTGKLIIHVTGNTEQTATSNESARISFNYTSSIPVGAIDEPERLLIYVDPIYVKDKGVIKPHTVTVGGSATYHLSLMAANLNITVTGSGAIEGYVVTGGDEVRVTGGSYTTVTLYYAPNAHFVVSGSGRVNGAIVANTFLGDGNIRVYYDDVAFENFPFEILDPITGGSGSTAPMLLMTMGNTIEQ